MGIFVSLVLLTSLKSLAVTDYLPIESAIGRLTLVQILTATVSLLTNLKTRIIRKSKLCKKNIVLMGELISVPFH